MTKLGGSDGVGVTDIDILLVLDELGVILEVIDGVCDAVNEIVDELEGETP